MVFLINCDNNGCNKTTEAKLDTSSNQVICLECGKEIKSVSQFAKSQMKSLGQVLKASNKQKAFAMKCDKCGDTDVPVRQENKIVCAKCKADLKISAHFEKLLIDHIKNSVDDK